MRYLKNGLFCKYIHKNIFILSTYIYIICVCIIYKIIKTGHPIANACVCMHTFLIYHFKAKVKKNFLFYTLIVREILYILRYQNHA